jgi:hypothetical protein
MPDDFTHQGESAGTRWVTDKPPGKPVIPAHTYHGQLYIALTLH